MLDLKTWKPQYRLNFKIPLRKKVVHETLKERCSDILAIRCQFAKAAVLKSNQKNFEYLNC